MGGDLMEQLFDKNVKIMNNDRKCETKMKQQIFVEPFEMIEKWS